MRVWMNTWIILTIRRNSSEHTSCWKQMGYTRHFCPWNSPGKNAEQLAVPFTRESFQPRDQTLASCIAGRFFTIWVTREALDKAVQCAQIFRYHVVLDSPLKDHTSKYSVPKNGYLQNYLRSKMVAQTVKNPLGMQQTWVWSLAWEDPLEEGMATPSILAWRTPWTKGGAWWLQSIG